MSLSRSGSRSVSLLVAFLAISAGAYAQQQPTPAIQQAVARIVTREAEEMQTIRKYSPIVETYIQRAKTDPDKIWAPDGDHYFIGRANFANGFKVDSLDTKYTSFFGRVVSKVNKVFDFETEFVPKGFLQMVDVDPAGLNAKDYNFEYERREFLGEVRTLVFNVTPTKKGRRGRFEGRIWVEDQGMTIVRFDGTYAGIKDPNRAFEFDSWRTNAGPNLWLPVAIYSEVKPITRFALKAAEYKAQTRLWGYNPDSTGAQEELSKVLVESASPVNDQTQTNNDLSPLQEKREWDRQAADNVLDKLQKIGLVAPKGEVDAVLDTVVNIEVTNNLNIEPEVHCRVLMSSTMESFAIGHTIVLSRGLIDVLPDEASLAAMLAQELGRVLLTNPTDSQFAFFDRLLSPDDLKTLRDFKLKGTQPDDTVASARAAELLKNSPYKDQLKTAGLFMAVLHDRSRQIPSLINPRLGDAVLAIATVAPDTEDKPGATELVALPLGGRVKIDPWDDDLFMLKSAPVPNMTDRDKMPFEITPFRLYLTRVQTPAQKAALGGS
jgi:hypothetical protein